MSTKLENCCNRLKQEIKTAETCLADVGHYLASATEDKVEALDARLKSALAKRDAKRKEAKGAEDCGRGGGLNPLGPPHKRLAARLNPS